MWGRYNYHGICTDVRTFPRSSDEAFGLSICLHRASSGMDHITAFLLVSRFLPFFFCLSHVFCVDNFYHLDVSLVSRDAPRNHRRLGCRQRRRLLDFYVVHIGGVHEYGNVEHVCVVYYVAYMDVGGVIRLVYIGVVHYYRSLYSVGGLVVYDEGNAPRLVRLLRSFCLWGAVLGAAVHAIARLAAVAAAVHAR